MRVRVSTLHRFTQSDGTHWYCFSGYSIGPFATPAAREADIASHYQES